MTLHGAVRTRTGRCAWRGCLSACGFSGELFAIACEDCFDDLDDILAGLKHLRHKRHEVLVLQIMADYELTFPFRKFSLFDANHEAVLSEGTADWQWTAPATRSSA